MRGVNSASGILRVLSLLFKHGKREDLLKYGIIINSIYVPSLSSTKNLVQKPFRFKHF
jgi:hypothetical protein